MSDKKFDSIIFDMDGTLWDAVDSYCKIWDVTLQQCNIQREPVSREQLIGLMGKTIEKIVAVIVPEALNNPVFYETLDENERKMMPELGGKLYDGVKETLSVLAKKYKLFMVSNCSEYGLPTFLKYTGLSPYITATLSHGDTHRDKAYNITEIGRRYDLKAPLYVGDTQSDFDSCLQAGVEFAWAAYGFGNVPDATIRLNCFKDLLKFV